MWCGNLPPAQRGVVALGAPGVPIGHPDFFQAQDANSLVAETDLLCSICSETSLLQTYCRMLALMTMRSGPSLIVCWAIMQGPNNGDDWVAARQVVFVPPSLVFGLLASERVSPAAHRAAAADALPVLHQCYQPAY